MADSNELMQTGIPELDESSALLRAAETPEALADPLKKAAKVAVAATLASTLAAGVAPDKVHLPDPVPIVHVIDQGVDQPADQPSDQAPDRQRAPWKKIMKWLVMALMALLATAGLLLGAVKGCVGIIGAPFAGDDGKEKTEQVQPATEHALEAAPADAGQAAPAAA